jgi:hypothetical protein
MSQDLHALIAKEAYAQPNQRAKEIQGYYLDDTIGDDENAVYRNPETQDVVQGLRGTQTGAGWKTTLGDLRNDIGVALPFLSRSSGLNARTNRAEKVYNDIAERYGRAPALSGHSLGGSVAQRVLGRVGKQNPETTASTFNMGTGLLPTLNSLKCRLPKRFRPSFCDRATNYRVKGDVVSLTSRLGTNFGRNVTQAPAMGGSRHTIGQFV